jgi:hypothetical protein
MEIPTGYGQANFRFTGTAVPTGAEITLGIDVSAFSGTPTGAAQELADSWAATNIDAYQGTVIALTSISLKYGPTATGPTGEWTGSLPGVGTGSGVTPNVALLVQKVTALGGRAGRGRLYLPGLAESHFDEGGNVSGTVVTGVTGAFEALRADLESKQLSPVLLHGEGSPITTPTPITEFVASGTGATQRRRLRR